MLFLQGLAFMLVRSGVILRAMSDSEVIFVEIRYVAILESAGQKLDSECGAQGSEENLAEALRKEVGDVELAADVDGEDLAGFLGLPDEVPTSLDVL